MSENIFKPSIFNPLAEYFEELTENENTNFKVFTDAKYDIDEMFQKDEVNNLYVEFGNDLLNKDLEELVSIKQAKSFLIDKALIMRALFFALMHLCVL